MNAILSIARTDRVLVVAPHPDDETLATGGLLQLAVEVGAAVRVVFVTDGDRNPWAQRAFERRLRIGPEDRMRFAALRRRETISALGTLGVPADAAEFLGLPDQGTTDLLLRADHRISDMLAEAVLGWRPTVLAVPDTHDLHPDHNAAAVLMRLCCSSRSDADAPRVLSYVVHRARRSQPLACQLELSLSEACRQRKLAAILCHRSQMFWRRGWLLGFAAPVERYNPSATTASPIRAASRERENLVIEVASSSHWRAFGRRTLHILGADTTRSPLRLAIALPHAPGPAPVLDLQTGQACARALLRGVPLGGALTLPLAALNGHREVFAKIEHRFGFFDEAGWTYVEPR